MSRLTKIKDTIIFKDSGYSSFPNVIQLPNGKILVAFRHARDLTHVFGKTAHIDPASKAVYVSSGDQGDTWDPELTVIYDDFYLGIQDPCMNLLKDGTIFCTFFTWKVLLKSDTEPKPLDVGIYEDRWIGRLGDVYSIRSLDGGKTWDEPIPIQGQGLGVRGNCVELEDGSILLPMYVTPDDVKKVLVSVTEDRGKTWETLSVVATSEDCYFREPNLYRTEAGKLVAFMRSEKLTDFTDKRDKYPLFTSESYDNGKTWVNLKEHRIYSPSPFHCLRLASGNVLITYGHRNEPYGIRALLLDAELSNLETAEEIVLRDDGLGFDIGYTSSVQLDNGDILVTYYYFDEDKGKRYIGGTFCREMQ